MDKELARRYVDRWQAVREIEEVRARWKRLNDRLATEADS